MEGAFAWVGAVAEWVGQWIPRWVIVRTTHGAVKFVRGAKVVPLGPGWHVYWPFQTDFVIYPIVRQAINLTNQTMETADHKTVMVGGMIVYEVHDIAALVAYTFDPDDTIKDIAAAAIHDVCCTKTWEQLQQGQRDGSLDREMKAEMKKGLGKFGVTVLRTTLTELASCRVIKIISGS